MPGRDRLIAGARAWVGTPWAPAGTAKGVGANCLGFLAGAARDAGLFELAHAAAPHLGYATPPDAAALLRGLRRHLRPVPCDRARPGDLLLFDLGAGLRHVALLSAPGTIIHAHQSKGRVVEHRLTWSPHSAYRIPGLD